MAADANAIVRGVKKVYFSGVNTACMDEFWKPCCILITNSCALCHRLNIRRVQVAVLLALTLNCLKKAHHKAC